MPVFNFVDVTMVIFMSFRVVSFKITIVDSKYLHCLLGLLLKLRNGKMPDHYTFVNNVLHSVVISVIEVLISHMTKRYSEKLKK